MNAEQAIEIIENYAPDRGDWETMRNALMVAMPFLREQAEREKGCEYCNGTEAEYYHTSNTKLSLNTFGKARTLITECDPCPPYANCALKNIPARSAFIINFCPECGKRLEGRQDG